MLRLAFDIECPITFFPCLVLCFWWLSSSRKDSGFTHVLGSIWVSINHCLTCFLWVLLWQRDLRWATTQYLKTFYVRNLWIFEISLNVCHCQAFPAWCNVCEKGWSLPKRNTFPLKGRLLAVPTNNRLGWKCLLGANTLAFYKN